MPNIAAQEEKLKLRLEGIFEPISRRLLNMITRDFEETFPLTGQIQPMSIYADDWTAALKAQYRRVKKAFSRSIRGTKELKALMTKAPPDDRNVDAELGAAFAIYMAMRSREQANFILQETNKLYAQEIEDQRFLLQQDGGAVSNLAIATAVGASMRKRNASRSPLIANMQTQGPAETVKAMEAMALAGRPLTPFRTPPAQESLLKTWITVGDERVRETHVSANTQRRIENEPFLVGGELLRYPGDTSLGASIGNVANCRCSARYSIGST